MINKHIDRLQKLSAQFIQYQTTEDRPDEITNCLSWVSNYISAHAPAAQIHKLESQGKKSLFITRETLQPKIIFCAHLDVVSAHNSNLFTAICDSNGRLVGRGAADMKGPAAALLDIFVEEAIPEVGVLFTTDEEIGGENGVKYFLKMIDWQPDVVILPDGGANMRLITEQKGILRIQLNAAGQSAHSARPWLGDNAIVRLSRAYEALLRKYPTPMHEDDWRASITLTQINGGSAPNVVPLNAIGTLDIRYPFTSQEDAMKLYQSVCATVKRYQVTTTLVSFANGFTLDVFAPAVDVFQNAAKQILGAKLPLSREAGASDARFFSERNIVSLMYQPVCGGWHTEHEWVDLQSLYQFRQITSQFSTAYADITGSEIEMSDAHFRDALDIVAKNA